METERKIRLTKAQATNRNLRRKQHKVMRYYSIENTAYKCRKKRDKKSSD